MVPEPPPASKETGRNRERNTTYVSSASQCCSPTHQSALSAFICVFYVSVILLGPHDSSAALCLSPGKT